MLILGVGWAGGATAAGAGAGAGAGVGADALGGAGAGPGAARLASPTRLLEREVRAGVGRLGIRTAS